MTTATQGFADWLFVACGVWLIGLGAYFIFVRPPLLPEDLRYAGTTALALQAAAPRIVDWLNLVFNVMGGFMAGAGAMVLYFASAVLPTRPRGSALTLAVVGFATVGLMSMVNFMLHSDFRWLLIVPPVLWAVALGGYVYEGSSRAS